MALTSNQELMDTSGDVPLRPVARHFFCRERPCAAFLLTSPRFLLATSPLYIYTNLPEAAFDRSVSAIEAGNSQTQVSGELRLTYGAAARRLVLSG